MGLPIAAVDVLLEPLQPNGWIFLLDLLIKWAFLVNAFDIEFAPDKAIQVLLQEAVGHLMGQFGVESSCFVGVEVVADNPFWLPAQQLEVA